MEATERIYGKDHPLALMSRDILAQLYLNQRRYSEAEALFLRVLETQERLLGRDDPKTLSSVGKLANYYSDQGRYGEAETLNKRALEALDTPVRQGQFQHARGGLQSGDGLS